MPLRVLHTADWHLGHVLHEFDRTYEHERLVDWLLDTIEREQVDAVLVAGDVFDAANPPTGAQALWYRFLVDAWRRTPHLHVVVIGGNHDSASRLDAIDPFLGAMRRLHVLGGIRHKDGALELDRLVIPLRDENDKILAWVAAVPFLRASETGTGSNDAVARGTRDVFDRVVDLARGRRDPSQPLIVMGHLHVAGGKVSDLSERNLVAGNQVAVSDDIFPVDVSYAALGHLHLGQAVGGRGNVRYSGSLLPLALSERTYPHQVVIVDFEGSTATPRTLRAPRFVEILHVPGDGIPADADTVSEIIRTLPARGGGPESARPLLRVNVHLDGPDPTLRQRIQEALEGKETRLAQIAVTTAGTGAALGDLEVRAIAELTPEEVFRAKHEKDFGGPVPDDLVAAFHELVDQVNQEQP